MSFWRKAILKGGGDGAGKALAPSMTASKGPNPSASSLPYNRPPGRQLIPAASIQLGMTLGEGEFGVVQQGVWKTEQGDMQVAVKRLSRERMNTGTQNFLKEAAIMQGMDNEHIVRMFGVVLDTENNVMLVTELAPMRSLLECLRDSTLRADLPITCLCDYAIQVCDGMTYLESKRLVHRDLAARNILVFNKNLVKISDLGLSRLLGVGQDYYQSKFSVSLKLPIAWCAPECINFLKFTSASDVWSFGVTLWEFFTYGSQPWAGLSSLQILEAIDEPKFQRLEQPELCPPELYKLMTECWTHDPESRPRFSDILFRLPQLRPVQVKAVKDYPSPLVDKGYIEYKAGDVIVVIDKSPVTSSLPGLVWKGVLANGKSGLFDPTNAVPFIEPKADPVPSKGVSIVRRDSSRKSGKKVRANMISLPQNDLRHTGHIGFDGVVFGDVSFIGDNYDKLPGKMGPDAGVSRSSSFASRKSESLYHNGHIEPSSSPRSLYKNNNVQHGAPWVSEESLNSQSHRQAENEGRYSPNYLDIEDDSVFSDFKIPELGSSFDFGPSFMDEVLRALDEKEKQAGSGTSLIPAGHFSASKLEPPLPAPREIRTSSSSSSSAAPPLPAPPPRVEHPKERKQTKVKAMSASEEKMVDTAMARARDLTSHLIGYTSSPPISPSQELKPSFFDDDTGFISRLRNSIKLSSSPKNGRTRTFSEELEQKGDLDVVTPEAQQAYNMLVVRGSFKEKSLPDFQHHMVTQDSGRKDMPNTRKSGSQSSSKSSQEIESSDWAEANVIRDSKNSSSFSKISPASSQLSPVISLSHSPGKSVFMPHANPGHSPAPVPSPRPAKRDNPVRLDLFATGPQNEIPKVEPTIQQMSLSPRVAAKHEQEIERSSIKHCNQPKVTIEVEEVDDSEFIHDDVFEKAATSLERSSLNSPQRFTVATSERTADGSLGLEHLSLNSPQRFTVATSERTADKGLGLESRLAIGTSERTADSSLGLESSEHKICRNSHQEIPANSSSVYQNDSSSRKLPPSEFDEDLTSPSPQEIMNRLRQRRLNRHLEQQRTATTEGETSSVTSRPRPSAREPQGIPGRVPAVDDDEVDEKSKEDVDTNPLRMLRGGAVPVRMAGRSSGGTISLGSRVAKALRVPQLNFSKNLSSSVIDQQARSSAGDKLAAHLGGTVACPEGTAGHLGGTDTCREGTAGLGGAGAHLGGTAGLGGTGAHLGGTAAEVVSHHQQLSSPVPITLDVTAKDITSSQAAPLNVTSSLPASISASSSLPASISASSSLPASISASSSLPASISAPSSLLESGSVTSSQLIPSNVTSSLPAPLSVTSSAVKHNCASSEQHRLPAESANVVIDLNCTTTARVTLCSDNSEELPNRYLPRVDVTAPPALTAGCQSSPCPHPDSQLNNVAAVASGETSQTLNVVNLAPPRLPPRRSQSLNENSEKAAACSSGLPSGLRRSSSTEESNESPAPALPPRQPHGSRTPLNARPRERKFPLQIHLSPQEKSPTHPSPPDLANAPSVTPKQISHLRSPTHASATSSVSSTSSHSPHQFPSAGTSSRHQENFHTHRQPSDLTSPTSPSRNPASRHSCLHNPPRSQSFESPSHHLHHHHSSSIELPPPYDISVQQSVSLSDVADSEPTHMLLDPHTSHLPIPLSVSLPPSSDLTAIDEPTHVSLSSLSANKHSWSATFTSPSPLSPSFHHRQQPSTRSSQINATRTLDQSFNSESKAPSLYPDVSDNQSPPADLPPAPPTPSYREKLGLENRRPKVVRSISHNSNTFKSGPQFLSVDSSSSNSSFRGRSASTSSPLSKSHHKDVCSTSSSHNSSCRLAHYSHAVNDNDDSFFAEAPSYPHPYSQSPFHPLVSARGSSETSLIYSSVSFPQSTPDISPYQISSAISSPGHSSKHSFQFEPPPSAIRRSTDNHSADSHAHSPPVQDSSPRSRTTPAYNSVCIPPSHHTADSSKTSSNNLAVKQTSNNLAVKQTSNNLAAKPTNSPACRPETQTVSSSKQHQTSSSTPQIFKFPSVVRTEGSFASSSSSAAQINPGTGKNHPDLSPSREYPSSSEVSPLMFASYNATSSVSYEDLRQFALDRQKNCEEVEILLKIFSDQVTVDECMTALEGTQWDVNKATKYLQLKKLLSLGMADVHRCKEALSATGWDLQSAAETLLESARGPGVSSSSSSSSSSRGSPARSGMLPSHHRPTSPEVLDV